MTHDVLACWFGVSRSTVSRAVSEVRPLLAEGGWTVAAGVRLRSLAEVTSRFGAGRPAGIAGSTGTASSGRLRNATAGSSPARAGRTRSGP
ncbi:transposase family protein [Streptomyces sp. NPDC056254]|uniref:helix-turn-helix domain-containing protein n=1 Tax=Streptomyces sp. NPDC056254 TaxID=3345763 RepID=UPI0035DECF54